jgi:putative SOS response-associated peptidase YedK
MGVASLWDRWTDTTTGEIMTSFTMLTVNADGHSVMGRFHRPEDEKRSVVVLEPGQFREWLSASNLQGAQTMARPSDGLLVSEAVALEDRPVQSGLF